MDYKDRAVLIDHENDCEVETIFGLTAHLELVVARVAGVWGPGVADDVFRFRWRDAVLADVVDVPLIPAEGCVQALKYIPNCDVAKLSCARRPLQSARLF